MKIQSLEWEDINDLGEISIVERGGFSGPVSKCTLSRNSDFELTITGYGESTPGLTHALSKREPRRAGEIIPEPPITIGKTMGGQLVEIYSIHSESSAVSEATYRVICSCNKIKIVHSKSVGDRLVEWVINLKINGLAYPRQTSRHTNTNYTIARGNNTIASIPVEVDTVGISDCSDHFQIKCKIGCREMHVSAGQIAGPFQEAGLNRGFIEYICIDGGPISDDERKAIRCALAFFIGGEIVSLGHSVFTKSGQIVSQTAIRPGHFGSFKSLSNPNQPPARIWLDEHPFLDEKKLEILVNKFLDKLSMYDLLFPLHFSWMGHGQSLDVQAFFFGTSIEAFRNIYMKKIDSELVNKRDWEAFYPKLIKLLENEFSGMGVRKEAERNEILDILKHKLREVNLRSSNQKYVQFFEALDLPLGEVEKNAIKERNNPAHGKMYEEDQYNQLIYTIKGQQTLFSRIYLKLVDHGTYIDYSCLDFPENAIHVPIAGTMV